MISEHRRFGGGLFGPRLWGTSCRSACRSEIGRENEQCFDPAWSSVCLCGPIHQKTMAKNWRTNHTLWLYPMVFVVGGGDYDRKSLFGASCFETKPYCGCCSNWGMSFYHPIHLRSFRFLTNNQWERRLLRFREARIYLRDLVLKGI